MASSSCSSSSYRTYDVFPSFSGEDVRRTFLSHFHESFESKTITTFKDQEIQRGLTIGPELIQAIRESKISIVILSKNYASSTWCLNELLEIMNCREAAGQKVMTIFYGVDPSDVRKQTGDFGEAFEKTCVEKTEEEKQKWRKALTDVANIAGEDSRKWDNEAEMIKKFATDVLNELNYSTISKDFDGLVGMGAHIEKMESLLCLESDEVRIVGIWGPAGIGKTTLTRVLYDRFSSNFQHSCFMVSIGAEFRETHLDDYGLRLCLQEQFLSKILHQENLRIRHLGVASERLKYQKVLVVLDGLDKLEQLEAVAGQSQWFGFGSRIIVTTNDKNLLIRHGINHVYEMDFPSSDEALQIFSQYAFGQTSPPFDLQDLVVEVASLTCHLPLGLKVLGSSLRGMCRDDWILALPRLRTSLDGNIEKVLRVGYDGIHEKDQEIFRHIACLFNFERVDRLKQLLNDSNLNISNGLQVLARKSLIQISTDRYVVMHNLLQQMGREIVRRKSTNKPWKREFLVNARDIYDVLIDNTGTAAILGISLNMSKINDCSIDDRAFEKMQNLRFLIFHGGFYPQVSKLHLPHGLNYLSRNLRLLHWDAYPAKSMPPKFYPEFLVELIMQESKLEKLWEGIQPLGSLREMDLSGSKDLKEFPDLSKATNLERLNLCSCRSLVTLPSSIRYLNKLTKLIMNDCEELEDLPTNMNLESLSDLDLSGCSRLKTFPEISSNIDRLNLSKTAIGELPSWIENLIRLRVLDMSNCKKLKNISSSISKLEKIEELFLCGCSDLENIPDCFKFLSQLIYLDLSNCRKLVSLPKLPTSLSRLRADCCESLERLSGSFNNPEMEIRFINCFKLNQTAQELIQQSVCECSCLPGRELPAYVTHQASASSLRIHLGKKPIFRSLVFRPCVVFDFAPARRGCGCIEIECHIIGKHGDTVLLKSWCFAPFNRPPYGEPQTDNLIIFGPRCWPNEDDYPEAELRHNEILLEFKCIDAPTCDIKEWGVQLSDPTFVHEEDESNADSSAHDNDVENNGRRKQRRISPEKELESNERKTKNMDVDI